MPIIHHATAAAEWRAYTPLVLTGMVGVALAATLTFTLGVMMPAIEAEFGWTRAQISTGPMLVSFGGLLLATAAGFVIDRVGARKVGVAVAIIMSSVLVLMSTMTNSLWHWWAIWGLFAAAAAATSTVWLAPISSLFVKSRGLALAVTLTGTGIASALTPVVCHYFVENYSWRTGYLAIGLVLGAVVIPLVLIFWRGAEEFGAQPDVNTDESKDAAPEMLPGMTVREGFTSANFYKIFAGYVISSVASIAIIMNLVPVLVSTGISAGQAAAVAGAHGLSSIAGRFIGGGAMDRVGAKKMIIISTLGAAALPLGLLLGSGSVTAAVAVVTINAFMGGMKMPAIVYLISRYFGPRSFGTLFGTISISSSIGVGIGPLIANHIYDMTQSYDLVLWVAVPTLAVAASLYALLGKYPDFAQPRQVI